jgi:M6 family metalloprotease-like protein
LTAEQNISDERYLAKRAPFDEDFHSRSTRSPSVGVVQSLVVFIRFSDQSEFSHPLSHYENLFNAQGHNVNSMYQYFWDASFQQLQVFSPIYPLPNGQLIVSYQAPQPRAYYLPFHAVTNQIGYQGETERRLREHGLLRDAIVAVRDQIPETLIIDSDNDGNVDNVNFIIRGSTSAWATLLWPHKWTLWTYDVRINGKRVTEYNMNIENHLNNFDIGGVSVLVHEFAHSFGLPDFYRYVNRNITPVGTWCLMATNTISPQSMTAHAMARYTDWVPEIPVVSSSGTYTLQPITVSQNNHALRIMPPNSTDEYFVVEYRSNQTGRIDSFIPNSGLIVYRVNPTHWGNANGPPDEVYIFRPGGTLTSDGALRAASFSEQLGRTEISDATDTRSFFSNGQAGGLVIYNIGLAGESISFYVDLDGPDPNDFDESFECQSFLSFDWINDSIAPWSISSEQSMDGAYSAVSGTIGDNQSSRLSVTLNVSSGYIQFWLKTSTESGGDFLRFLINNVETSTWSGVNDWTHYSTRVLSGTHTFTWEYRKNNSGTFGEDRVWIDQIGFPNIVTPLVYPVTTLSQTTEGRDITLNWSTPFTTSIPYPPTLIGYQIYQSRLLLNEVPVPDTTFSVYGVAGGAMQFWVVAVYEEGVSDNSNTVRVDLPLIYPTNLQANIEGNGVRLNWDFPEGINTNVGFRVFRDGVNITPIRVPASERTHFDTDVSNSQNYTYTVRAMFLHPMGVSQNSNETEIYVVDVVDDVSSIYVTELGYNHPNPFNPTTTIRFSIENVGNVEINVYNVRGQLVRTLVNDEFTAGHHNVIWDGKDMNNIICPSGIYFYRLTVKGFQDTKKMILLK